MADPFASAEKTQLLPRRRETVDARLYMAINSLPHHRGWDDQVELLSDLGKGAGWVAGGTWLALRDGARGRRAGVAAVAGMFAGVALVQGPLKRIFRRRRPFARRLAFVVGARPVDSSFPSGHTAGSFAAAVALARFYPRDRPLLLGLATAVGLSRIYLGHHFPSDVLVGAAIGSGIGLATGRLLQDGLGNAGDGLAAAEGAAGDGDPAGAVSAPRRPVPNRRRLLVET